MAGENWTRRRLFSVKGKKTKIMDIQVSEKLDDPEWDAFVVEHPCGHYAQTSLWAAVKKTIGWRVIRLIATEQNKIVAGAQLLLHPVPLLGNIGYVIKGPLYPLEDQNIGKVLFTQILKTTSKYHCFLIVIQPPNAATQFSELLLESSFQISRQRPEHTSTLIIDLSTGLDQIMACLKRQTRQSIQRSERDGIQIREGSHADLNNLYCLYQATSTRQEFHSYPLEYFETMWQVFHPQNHLILLLAEYQGETVSAMLLICFRATLLAYILGWSGQYSSLRPNHALFWGAIQWAEKNKYKYFDFGGIDPLGAQAVLSGEELPENLLHSPDFLKYGFGGKITFYPPAYDYVPTPFLNWIFRKFPYHQFDGNSIFDKSVFWIRKVLMRN